MLVKAKILDRLVRTEILDCLVETGIQNCPIEARIWECQSSLELEISQMRPKIGDLLDVGETTWLSLELPS